MGYIFFKKTRAFGAVVKGDLNKLRELLDQGLSPDTRDDRGGELLFRAVEQAKTDIVRLLLKRGAKIPCDNWYGSVLHVAADTGAFASARMLLERDVSLLQTLNRFGNTPLHVAAKSGRADIVALLLEKGADPFTKNADNRDALFLSDHGGHKRVSDILLQYRSKIKMRESEERHIAAAVGAAFNSPVPAAEDENGAWRRLSNDKIALVTHEKDLGYRLIEVFNFSRGECLRIVRNVNTQAESHETKYFDEMRGQGILEEAFNELAKRGTTLDREVVLHPPRKSLPKQPPGQ